MNSIIDDLRSALSNLLEETAPYWSDEDEVVIEAKRVLKESAGCQMEMPPPQLAPRGAQENPDTIFETLLDAMDEFKAPTLETPVLDVPLLELPDVDLYQR